MQVSQPSHDHLFVEPALYEYRLPIEYAVACYYMGEQVEAIKLRPAAEL